jgi:hypothetical protein
MNSDCRKQQRLGEGGVCRELRESAGTAVPQAEIERLQLEPTHRETPLAGRRAGDAIAGGVRSRIFHTSRATVKCSARRSRGA